jgi:diguanylate cyclase (GGDEF)-like protein
MATILIVDTNPADRRTYITLLGNFGHRLLEADNGAQAMQISRTELPDLIITDIAIPDTDGFALVRNLRAEPLLAGTPVIFHTSDYDDSEVHKKARSSGVQHILRNPAEPQEILRAVNETLENPMMLSRFPQAEQLQRDQLLILANKLHEKVLELEKMNEHLRSLSLNDRLTGLNNRHGFMILATGLLKFTRRAGYSACLIYIDLDSLKFINNKFGHIGGDKALTSFARILTETFRESDVMGRLGGDEFVILLIDADENDIADMQARLESNVDAYNLQVGGEYALSFSLGVIRVEADSSMTMETLLSQADEAMYKHKQFRKNKV